MTTADDLSIKNFYVAPNINLEGKAGELIRQLKKYCLETDVVKVNPLYVISTALGEIETDKIEVNEEGAVAILIPGYKIVLVNIELGDEAFENFCEDFIEDLGYRSEKYGYKNKIGRPRQWKSKNIISISYSSDINWSSYKLEDPYDKRIGELLISLLIGSINDINRVGITEPKDIIQKVRRNIVLFDCDQTRFLYSEDFKQRLISIQGLSGTGKTELLLNRLKDIYTKYPESKIFFTCHNKVLANDLKKRIPNFFNFMRVDKQIDWNTRLWVDRAWGNQGDSNSGLYSYICSFYKIPFLPWSRYVDYEYIFAEALKAIDAIPKDQFKYAFDYIFIDEQQDFPPVFFDLCERITREKVFAAGDVFQNIFFNYSDSQRKFDIVLNRCYRTDPRTLMFAHAIGMALFEKEKLNFFPQEGWEALGYSYELANAEKKVIHLSREPVKRFQDLEEDFESMILIRREITSDTIVSVLQKIKQEYPAVQPDDIAIIGLDDNEFVFNLFDQINFDIESKLGWEVNRAHESKEQLAGTVYLTNPNNVKGLEFPFVICFTKKIVRNRKSRNILYTMLTRSFIQSYLIVESDLTFAEQSEGLRLINNSGYIETVEPTAEEMVQISDQLTHIAKNLHKSASEIISEIFDELEIFDSEKRKRILSALMNYSTVELLNEDKVRQAVKTMEPLF